MKDAVGTQLHLGDLVACFGEIGAVLTRLARVTDILSMSDRVEVEVVGWSNRGDALKPPTRQTIATYPRHCVVKTHNQMRSV